MSTPANSYNGVSVGLLPPVARFNLRTAPTDLAVTAKAFGLKLPNKIGEGVQKKDRAAFCIGPDEWLLHAAETSQSEIVTKFDAVRSRAPHSLTVLSDREVTLEIKGPDAIELLSVACPIDVSLMPVTGAKRTVFDYAQVVIIRDDDEAFRLEVWRSFLPHVQGLLEIAVKELSVGL